MLSVRNFFISNYMGYLKVKGWKKIYYANINNEITGMAILISAKVDFRVK